MKQGLNFKRFFASLLLLAVSTLSFASDFWENGIYYDINPDGTSVTVTSGYTKYSGSVVIPTTVNYSFNRYSVTSIGSSAFSDCSGLTSVTIPESVTSIGSSAFSGCSGLTSITIPNKVTSIGSYAFSGCSGITSVTINSNAILSKNYSWDNNLKNIFGEQVKEYVIGNGVTSIGEQAFVDCSGLTSVTIGNSVTSIGEYAFSGCSGLTSVTIGKSVTSIGQQAFYGCSDRKSVV